jgi:hypothetical protein
MWRICAVEAGGRGMMGCGYADLGDDGDGGEEVFRFIFPYFYSIHLDFIHQNYDEQRHCDNGSKRHYSKFRQQQSFNLKTRNEEDLGGVLLLPMSILSEENNSRK